MSANVPTILSDFSRGELSPRLAGSSHREEFYRGAATVENFIVLPQGGLERRPGTRYFGTVETTSVVSRLVSFILSEDTYYVLEFYDEGIRVIDPSVPQFNGTRYTMTLDVAPATDWAAGAKLTGQTSGETAYVLKKVSGTSWIISEPSGDFTDGETLRAEDEDGNDVDANQGAGYPTVAESSVTSIVQDPDSAAFYTDAQVAAMKWVQINDQMVFVCGTAVPKILTYLDGTGWIWEDLSIEIPSWVSPASVRSSQWYTGRIRANFVAREGQDPLYRKGQVVEYSGSYYRALNDVYSSTNPATDTTNWIVMSTNPDANPFDTAGDYPTAVGFKDGRLVFAGTVNNPSTMWGSAVNEYLMFVLGPNDGDAVSFTFASDRQDKVQWIAAREVLMFGTTGGEWIMAGGSAGITPSAVLAKRYTTFGSSAVQAKLVNQNVLFVQKGGRKIREYEYRNELQAYYAPDLTALSEHITESGVAEIMFQSDPDPILWVVREDGELAGLTYDKASDVLGWHRHVTDGEIESICIVPNGEEEQIWVTVKRTIDGSDTRYIEYFESRYHDVQRDYFHVDSGITVDGGATFSLTAATAANPVSVTATAHGLSTDDYVLITGVAGMTELEGRVFKVTVVDANTFTLNNEDGSGRTPATAGTVEHVYNTVTGLSHLEGETVDVQVDGGAHAQCTVAAGVISLATGTYGNTIHVGMPYVSDLESMNILAGVPQGKAGNIHEIRIRLIDTLGGSVGTSEDNLEDMQFMDDTVPLGQAPTLFTGEKTVPVRGPWTDDLRAFVRQDQPLPMTIALMVQGVNAYGGA